MRLNLPTCSASSPNADLCNLRLLQSAGFKIDRSVYSTLSLDLQAPKVAPKPGKHGVTYIHDSDENAADEPDVYDRILIQDLIAPISMAVPREDDGWEVVEKSPFIFHSLHSPRELSADPRTFYRAARS